jgi:hypothetical protein
MQLFYRPNTSLAEKQHNVPLQTILLRSVNLEQTKPERFRYGF